MQKLQPSTHENLINRGIVEINHAERVHGASTIAVVGLPRSGTSMIASLLKELGVFMGDSIDDTVFEDTEIARLIESKDLTNLTTLARLRDAKYDVWGWKRPNAFHHLPELANVFRGMRVIVLFRDLLAIAKRNNLSMHSDVISSLPLYAREYGILISILAKMKCPLLLVSYEKFLQFPESSIYELSQFVGLTISSEKLQQVARSVQNGPDAYLDKSRLPITGRIDLIKRAHLYGWARVDRIPSLALKVTLYVNGQKIAVTKADKLRPDLVTSKINTGYHGFEFKIDEQFSPDCKVVVTAGDSNFVLDNGGKTIGELAKLELSE